MRYALLGFVLVVGLGSQARAQSGDLYVCDADTDCFHTGCSGQVCASVDVITTCEFTCEHACYQAASCECNGHRCGFQQSAALHDCLQECRQGGGPIGPAATESGALCLADSPVPSDAAPIVPSAADSAAACP